MSHVWSGLGANFANVGVSTQANYTAALSRLLGYTRKVRIHFPDYQSQSAVDQDVLLCQTARDLGFNDIVWGISSNRYNSANRLITKRNWPVFRQKILDYAAVAQTSGVSEYQVGNEEELHIYAVPSSMSRTSNVVTAVLSFTPDYEVGDTIYVNDATPSSFNGTFTLSTINGATLTWAQTAANDTATASKVTDFLKSELRTNLRNCVADVGAVFDGLISTAVSQDDYTGWVGDASMGSFDFLGYNIYGENSFTTFKSRTQAMVDAFPNKIKITELSVHSDWASTSIRGYGVTTRGFDEVYRQAISDRIAFLRSLNIPEAYLFTWQDSSDKWAVKMATGYRSVVSAFTGRIPTVVVDY